MADPVTCPVCGETAPTAWICVTRLAGVAKPGEPCGYSVEGDARMQRGIASAAERLRGTISEQANRKEARSHGA